jgi:hypothetical protein
VVKIETLTFLVKVVLNDIVLLKVFSDSHSVPLVYNSLSTYFRLFALNQALL